MTIRARFILNGIALICCFSSIYGQQTFKDSFETYKYWSERGVLEMTYAYMQDYISNVDTLKNVKDFKGFKDFRSIYIKDIENKAPANINSDFMSFNNFLLDNGWEKTSKRISVPLIENIRLNKVLDDNFFNGINTKADKTFWDLKKKEVINRYNDDLKSLKNKSVLNKDILVSDDKVETNDIKEKTNLNLLVKLLYFLAGLIIGILIIFFYTKHKIYSILFYEKGKYLQDLKESDDKYIFKFIGLVVELKKSKDNHKSKYEELEKKLNTKLTVQKEFSKPITQEQLKSNSLGENQNQEKNSNNTVEWKGNDVVANKRIFYFSIPYEDGSFLDEYKLVSKEHNSFYKIEMINEKTGKLYFIPGEFDKTALNDINGYLAPVCSIDNIENRQQANRIEFLSPGTVHLHGDSWKIDINNKVRIKLT